MEKDFETINTVEQRLLVETTRKVARLLTREEYKGILDIFSNALDREIETYGDTE